MSRRYPTGGGPWQRAVRPVLDRVLAVLGLVATGPLLILAAVMIKLTSPGPVFYRQIRAGRDGNPFTALKLRTMTTRLRDQNVQVGDTSDGVTAVGRWLRRFKIDELPQLFHVLSGEMALVGPRPTLPEQVEQYDDFQRRRLTVRPGLTGLAQVNGNASISWGQRIEYDVFYSDHIGPALDMEILLKTVGVALRGERYYARLFKDSPYALTPGAGTPPARPGTGERSS